MTLKYLDSSLESQMYDRFLLIPRPNFLQNDQTLFNLDLLFASLTAECALRPRVSSVTSRGHIIVYFFIAVCKPAALPLDN